MIIWYENALDTTALSTIRRLSGADLSRRFTVGDPQATDTLSVDALKARRVVGVYEVVTVS